jgi:hypothetical protein
MKVMRGLGKNGRKGQEYFQGVGKENVYYHNIQ